MFPLKCYFLCGQQASLLFDRLHRVTEIEIIYDPIFIEDDFHSFVRTSGVHLGGTYEFVVIYDSDFPCCGITNTQSAV